MRIRGLAAVALLACALLLAACGGGSGRYVGTDLVVGGSGPTAQLTGGDSVAFVMTITNAGDYDATNLTIRNATSQVSPPTISITCAASSGSTCPAVTGSTMTVPVLPVGGVLTFTISGAVNAGASGTISDTMSVSADSAESNSDNNTLTVSASTASNDVSVVGTAPTDPLLQGSATFSMVVSNLGPDVATNVVLTTSVSSTLTFDPAAISCIPTAGASAPTLQSDGTLLVATLPLNGVLSCSIPVTVVTGTSGFAIVTMVASAAGDSKQSNNTGTATIGATATNDVSVVGTAPPGPLVQGSATYLMDVTNLGPDVANNVVLATSVSSDLSFVPGAIVCVPSGGATAPSLQPDGSLLVASLPVNGLLNCSIPVTVLPGTNGFAIVTMVATSAGDTRTANNTATASVNATLTSDLSVVGTAPPGPLVTPSATFVMAVTNLGPADATSVTLTNSLSTNLTLAGPIACVPSGGAVAPVLQADGSLLSPLIPVNGALTCSIPVTVAPGVSGTVVDSLAVSSCCDLRPSNNSSTASVSATLTTDLSVVGTPPPGPLVTPEATFVMTVTNNGPASATDVLITNTLGPNLTLSGPIACQPAGGAVAPVLQADGTLLSPAIPLNGVLVCSIPVTVAAGNSGTVFDTLAVSNCCDVNASNNSAIAGVATTLTNNVAVTSNPSVASVPGGGSTTFSFLVSNGGPSTAFDVGLTNALSPNLTQTAPITCTATGKAVVPVAVGGVLTSAAIPTGDTLTCSVPVLVTAGANGNVSSTFTVSAANDERSGDNAATAVTLAISSDLGVSETAALQVAAGSQATFNAFVVNPRGQGTASNLVINWSTPSLPAGVSFASPVCTPTGGATCPTTLGPTMTLPTLLAGGQLQFTFVANTAPTARGDIVSTVSVKSDGDPNSANNAATATTTAVDGRNGTYQVFAADGSANVSMAITFNDTNGGQYTVTKAGVVSPAYGFTLEESTGDYVVAGNTRLRVVQDTLVGGHDFGNGPVPYVAVRSLSTSIAGAAGSYNLATRNVSAAGTNTHAGTALISGNTLSICQSDTPGTVAPVRTCDAASRKDYVGLVVKGNLISGTTAANETYTFSIASIGAAKVLLSAGTAPDGSNQLRIGLPDSTAGLTFGPPTRGASTNGDWVSITLSNATVPPSYTSSGANTAYAGFLSSANPAGAGPFSLLRDQVNGLYLTQASPLVIIVGGFGTGTSGLLQVTVP